MVFPEDRVEPRAILEFCVELFDRRLRQARPLRRHVARGRQEKSEDDLRQDDPPSNVLDDAATRIHYRARTCAGVDRAAAVARRRPLAALASHGRFSLFRRAAWRSRSSLKHNSPCEGVMGITLRKPRPARRRSLRSSARTIPSSTSRSHCEFLARSDSRLAGKSKLGGDDASTSLGNSYRRVRVGPWSPNTQGKSTWIRSSPVSCSALV